MTPTQLADLESAKSERAFALWREWQREHELKLELHPTTNAYRYGLGNGWHCKHWHWTLENAASCIKRYVLRLLVHGA